MTLAHVSALLSVSIQDVSALSSAKSHVIYRPSISITPRFGSAFAAGSPLRTTGTSYERKSVRKATWISIRCEQSTQESNSLDVWLGRLAMVGFAVAISVEIATGKGLLENFGLASPSLQ